MSEPINNLLRGLAPDQRRRITNALMADQYDRPTPQDGPVTERAGMFPLGTYANGQTGIAWPGFIAQPVESFVNLLQRGYQGGTGDTQGVEDAFNVAGGAMTGGLLAPRPRNSLGSSGRPQNSKGFDMSPEALSVRVEEMGLDPRTTWYHGTRKGANVQEFNLDLAGKATGGDIVDGVWLTSDRSQADRYGKMADAHYQRGSFTPQTMNRYKSDILELYAPKNDRLLVYDVGAEARRLIEDGYGSNFSEVMGSNMSDWLAPIVREARSKNKDGVLLRGIEDDPLGGYGYTYPANHLFVFNPAHVRSTSAIFDQEKVNSANIFAANANPLAAALAAYYGGNGQSGGR